MTFYLVHPLLLYICPVWGKDHSITLVLFNDRYQKVLNLLKKTLDYMERVRLNKYINSMVSTIYLTLKIDLIIIKKYNSNEIFWVLVDIKEDNNEKR